ncbi:MAG: TIGR00282 family metallophosphoesterase [Candidatus Kerfeldbacteria bacterium]|jgi:2',3'-cyclic-nucleotide 2'-phosphodiesterase
MPDNKEIKILFFGDIVGKPGRKAVTKIIPELKKELKPDLIIANVENLAHGIGITQKTIDQMLEAEIDFFTSGNHIWGKPAAYEILDNPDMPIIRPANYPDDSPGKGYKTILVGTKSFMIINMHGQVFIEDDLSNPFKKIDQILADVNVDELAGIFVDFHAEATSEKVAFGWHLDGRVSAVLGTHTHVTTADSKILPNGTAYQSDVGMNGLRDSIIGIDKDIILHNFTAPETKAHDISDTGLCAINATLITIDSTTRKSTNITRIYKEINV